MVKINLVWVLLFSFLACNNQPIQDKDSTTIVDSPIANTQVTRQSAEIAIDSSNYSGVLLLYSDSLQIDNQNFSIYNQNNSVFTTVASKNSNEPYSDKLKGKILAYYPDYYIVHFNAEKLRDGVYRVKVGTSSKIVKATKYVEYLSLPDYVLKFFVITTSANPLRSSSSETASQIKGIDYKQLSFKCLEINGDWVKVACNAECEGCPEGETDITGWVRWRKDGRIIVKQHYAC